MLDGGAGQNQKINDIVKFKIEYSNFLQNYIKKLNWKKLAKIVKIKASVIDFKYFNGMRDMSIKVFKIISN